MSPFSVVVFWLGYRQGVSRLEVGRFHDVLLHMPNEAHVADS